MRVKHGKKFKRKTLVDFILSIKDEEMSIQKSSGKAKKGSLCKTSNGKMKTSLCKKFTETGHCPYGNKCQFAHGVAELRCVAD